VNEHSSSDSGRLVEQLDAPSSLVDQAYAAIRRAVASHKIPPGSQLRQSQLAAELGVSPRTVREALNRLVAEGLAVHTPHKGASTIDQSADTVGEVHELRMLLEGWAFELAAERLTAEDLARMRELLPHTADPDPEAVLHARNANQEFHWIVIRRTGKQHLIRILEQLWAMAPTHILREVVDVEAWSEASNHDLVEHTELLALLEARDGAGARRLLQAHLQRTLDVYRGRMRLRDQR